MLRGWAAAEGSGVLACSALKDAYRKTLMQGMGPNTVQFILLDGSRELIEERLSARRNHYMNPKLLDSQLATLEPPADGLRVANDKPPEAVVDEIMRELGA
jgi:gluconokinase